MNIEAKNICKSFGDNHVITDFSLCFEHGTTTVIMGKSGCGKTTLLSILMEIVPPDSGEIIHELPFRRSAVFQENRLCENLTVSSNIRLVTGKKYSDNDISRYLDSIGLSGCENKPVRELSGGMKRRVALLRALLAEYDVLFLDEPFKGLDSSTKETVLAFTKKMISGKTVIMVTHDDKECFQLADKTVTL
ncbi:MAG: ATP-binding cassette domain-containing protein [Oscillospiraceae bacterium]